MTDEDEFTDALRQKDRLRLLTTDRISPTERFEAWFDNHTKNTWLLTFECSDVTIDGGVRDEV